MQKNQRASIQKSLTACFALTGLENQKQIFLLFDNVVPNFSSNDSLRTKRTVENFLFDYE